ncbi:hypothetical protein [Almyronema epifaneia]|uniref:Uncharacterized protein n=1 Tax=Almyronema epifaneia S1 TaxID=2991925 RepID=A0ABW6IFV2_9CYAN
MRLSYPLLTMGLAIALGFGWLAPAIRAARSPLMASTCPYAQIRLETTQAIDRGAICVAARPWFRAGLQVLVYFTDTRPANPGLWRHQVRQVEAAAGLRTLPPDRFEPNAIALSLTLAPELTNNIVITYGDQLSRTPIDDPARLEAVKQAMSQQLPTQPTAALVTGLEQTYQLFADVPPSSVQNLPQQTMPSTATPVSEILWLLGGSLLTLGGLMVGAIAWRHYRHQQSLAARLQRLQTATANLLMACNRLLLGDWPEATALYQQFVAAGGLRYPSLIQQVTAALAAAQAEQQRALQQQPLKQPLAITTAAMKRTLRHWEWIYLTLLGSRDRTFKLSNSDLQALLQPDLPDTARWLVKVELEQIDPAHSDCVGVVGYIAEVQQILARLQQAPQQAPTQLATLQQSRQTLADQLSPALQLAPAVALQPLDSLIQQATSYLNQDLPLSALEVCQQAEQVYQTLAALNQALTLHERQQAEICAYLEQGLQPPLLAAKQQRVKQLLVDMRRFLEQGQDAAVKSSLPAFNQASQQALALVHTWHQRYQANQQTLSQLKQTLTAAQTELEAQAQPNWRSLQAYPQPHWQDLTGCVAEAAKTLAQLNHDQMPQLEKLTSLAQQDLPQAERLATEIATTLQAVTQQMQQMSDRLRHLQTTEPQP